MIYLLSSQSRWPEFSAWSRLSLGALGAILSPGPLYARFTLEGKKATPLYLLLCLSQISLYKKRVYLVTLETHVTFETGESILSLKTRDRKQ